MSLQNLDNVTVVYPYVPTSDIIAMTLHSNVMQLLMGLLILLH